MSQLFLSFFQPALLKAIFNVDPDEVRSLIFKKEDVNAQVICTTSLCFLFAFLLLVVIINKESPPTHMLRFRHVVQNYPGIQSL